jgi:hypothetical protein
MVYFHTKKTEFGNISESFGVENVGTYILYPFGILTAFGIHILWPICTFCGHLIYFLHRFGMLFQQKSGNPGCMHVSYF